MPLDFSWGKLLIYSLARKFSSIICSQKSSGHHPTRAGVSAEICSLEFHSPQAPQFCWTKSSWDQIQSRASLETESPGSPGYYLSLLPPQIRLLTEALPGLGREEVFSVAADENFSRKEPSLSLRIYWTWNSPRLPHTSELPVVSTPGSVSQLGLAAAQLEASLHSDGV